MSPASKTLSALVALVLVVTASTPRVQANIFGRDDRRPVLSREFPYRCVGLIVNETSESVSTGTGCLIGPNLVLTNAHVVLDDSTGKPSRSLRIRFNQIDGVASYSVRINRVWLGTESLDDEPLKDWAVVRLDSNVGDLLGWLPISPKLTENAVLVGYSGEYRDQKTAAVSPGVLRPIDDVEVRHSADASRGSSGGPLIGVVDGRPAIVALNFAEHREEEESMILREYSDEFANYALAASSFSGQIAAIVAEEEGSGVVELCRALARETKSGDWILAEGTVEAILKACPANCAVRLIYSAILQSLGRDAEARREIKAALDRDPKCLSDWLVRAEFLLREGNKQECISSLNWILVIQPNHQRALEILRLAQQ
jgi:V8-like Glu-specific endopeptidase